MPVQYDDPYASVATQASSEAGSPPTTPIHLMTIEEEKSPGDDVPQRLPPLLLLLTRGTALVASHQSETSDLEFEIVSHRF